MKTLIFAVILLGMLTFAARSQSNYNDYPASMKEQKFRDFFNSNTNQWWTGDASTVSRIDEGHYVLDRLKDGAAASWVSSVYIDESRDFEIETLIKLAKASEKGYVSGILWGKQLEKFHYFIFGFNDNQRYVIACFNPNWEAIKDWSDGPMLRKNDYNKLTIRKVAQTYYFFINEVPVLTTAFRSLLGPQIGFHVAPFSAIHIDELSIYYLKSRSQSNEPRLPGSPERPASK
jgi:hypothetical protein